MEEVINRAKIISISLTSQEKEWLDAMEISPTALMKQKIMEMMTSSLALRKTIKDQDDKIERLIKKIEQTYSFMEKEGILNKFQKEYE